MTHLQPTPDQLARSSWDWPSGVAVAKAARTQTIRPYTLLGQLALIEITFPKRGQADALRGAP